MKRTKPGRRRNKCATNSKEKESADLDPSVSSSMSKYVVLRSEGDVVLETNVNLAMIPDECADQKQKEGYVDLMKNADLYTWDRETDKVKEGIGYNPEMKHENLIWNTSTREIMGEDGI